MVDNPWQRQNGFSAWKVFVEVPLSCFQSAFQRHREKDWLNSVDIFSLQGAFEIPLVFSENFLLRNLFWAAGERPFDKASLYP